MSDPVEATPATTNALRVGVLGPLQIAFFVVSAAGPLIAMAGGIPVAMLFGNGAGLPAMFLIVSLILLAFSRGYTAMAKRVRNSGAFYAFAAQGLGGHAAGATGLIALLCYNAIQVAIYGLFGSATATLLSGAGFEFPWWGCSLAAMAAIAFLGYRQIDLSARILGLLVAAEYVSVFVLNLAILRSGGASGVTLSPFSPAAANQGSPAIGILLCFSAFIGFEATTIYSEEARDPERTIPLATYLSVLLIGCFYTFSTWAMVIGIGADRVMSTLTHGDPTEILFDMSDQYVGRALTHLMRVLFVTSAFASLLAFHNSISRYLYAMGREQLLPAQLGITHNVHRSPHVGSFVQTATAFVAITLFALCGADPILTVFTIPSAVGTLGIIILMAITSLAAFQFLGRNQKDLSGRIASLVSLIAFGLIAALAAVRFDVLAGTSSLAVRSLPLLIVAVGLAGTIITALLRKRNPDAFERLGISRPM